MRYERCVEFPLIIEKLEPDFNRKLNYLDIGSGDSALPSYILKNSIWDVTCIDKYSWVIIQKDFAAKVLTSKGLDRLKIIKGDFMNSDLPAESFDVITNISVIEHFEKENDSLGMKKSAKLLKKGGLYILSTPYNEGFYKEFFLKQNVYGTKYNSEPVFFQRHYDNESLEKRIIQASGLTELQKKYFGEYGFQFKEIFIDPTLFLKPLKIFYQWLSPYFAKKFISIENYPVSRKNMKIYTSAGVFLVMTKA